MIESEIDVGNKMGLSKEAKEFFTVLCDFFVAHKTTQKQFRKDLKEFLSENSHFAMVLNACLTKVGDIYPFEAQDITDFTINNGYIDTSSLDEGERITVNNKIEKMLRNNVAKKLDGKNDENIEGLVAMMNLYMYEAMQQLAEIHQDKYKHFIGEYDFELQADVLEAEIKDGSVDGGRARMFIKNVGTSSHMKSDGDVSVSWDLVYERYKEGELAPFTHDIIIADESTGNSFIINTHYEVFLSEEGDKVRLKNTIQCKEDEKKSAIIEYEMKKDTFNLMNIRCDYYKQVPKDVLLKLFVAKFHVMSDRYCGHSHTDHISDLINNVGKDSFSIEKRGKEVLLFNNLANEFSYLQEESIFAYANKELVTSYSPRDSRMMAIFGMDHSTDYYLSDSARRKVYCNNDVFLSGREYDTGVNFTKTVYETCLNDAGVFSTGFMGAHDIRMSYFKQLVAQLQWRNNFFKRMCLGKGNDHLMPISEIARHNPLSMLFWAFKTPGVVQELCWTIESLKSGIDKDSGFEKAVLLMKEQMYQFNDYLGMMSPRSRSIILVSLMHEATTKYHQGILISKGKRNEIAREMFLSYLGSTRDTMMDNDNVYEMVADESWGVIALFTLMTPNLFKDVTIASLDEASFAHSRTLLHMLFSKPWLMDKNIDGLGYSKEIKEFLFGQKPNGNELAKWLSQQKENKIILRLDALTSEGELPIEEFLGDYVNIAKLINFSRFVHRSVAYDDKYIDFTENTVFNENFLKLLDGSMKINKNSEPSVVIKEDKVDVLDTRREEMGDNSVPIIRGENIPVNPVVACIAMVREAIGNDVYTWKNMNIDKPEYWRGVFAEVGKDHTCEKIPSLENMLRKETVEKKVAVNKLPF